MIGIQSGLFGWSLRAYRRVLVVYPREFRRRYGAHMRDLFELRLRDALIERGGRGLIVLWLATTRDVLHNGLLEHIAGWRARLRAVGTPPANAARQRFNLGGPMYSVFSDLRYAARTFAKNPTFTLVAVLTLGLGMGGTTAIFSVVRAVLLAPLPYDDPSELTMIWGELRNRNILDFPASPRDLLDYRQATMFDGIAGAFSFGGSLTGDGEAEQVQVGFVTQNFFSLLGAAPVLGRDLEPNDATPFNPLQNPNNAPPPTNALILGHGFWQRRYGGDPGVLGRSLQLSGGPAQIVGVAPPGFELLLPPAANVDTDIDLWTAARLDFDNAPRINVFLRLIGRLADGVTTDQAQAELDAIGQRIRSEVPIYETADFHPRVEPLHEDLTRHVRGTMWALLGAVAFVLLIACANVANLLMVRATARTREISIRAAIGGTRTRLIRQLLAESVLLSVLGAGLGLVLSAIGIRALVAMRPANLPRLDAIGMDGAVLAFAAGATILAALLFGTLPALQASRASLTNALQGRTDMASAGWQGMARNGMVVGEVALSLVLLIGTGLMVRSFVELTRVNPGFDPAGVLTFQAALPVFEFPQPRQRAAFNAQLQERLRGLPGVVAVGAAFPLPLSGQAFNGRYGTAAALEDERNFLQADYRAARPGYFAALGTRVLEGRTFTEADNTDSAAVVVVDEVLARKTWPGESAVGKRLLVRATSPEPQWVDVVGVVEHQRHQSLSVEGRETVYFTTRYVGSFGGVWTVKTETDPLLLANAIRNEVAALNTNVPVSEMRPMMSFVNEARAPTRFALVLIAIFGGSALVLASVGLYGVLSYVVRQRTAEIGVRMAFGAEPGRILKLVVRQGMVLALSGLGIGLVAAFGLTRAISSLLVDVAPTDPVTFVGISVVFLLVALTATAVPAYRATRIQPVEALRAE